MRVNYWMISKSVSALIPCVLKRARTSAMPKGPKGEKRPADVIGAAVKVMRIATGEITEEAEDDGKNKAAVELGRKGGQARAKKLSKKRRAEIAKNAAASRWSKK